MALPEGELNQRDLYGCLPWMIYFFVLVQVFLTDGFLLSREAKSFLGGPPNTAFIIGSNVVAAVGLVASITLLRRMRSARLMTLCYFGGIVALEVITLAFAGSRGLLKLSGAAATAWVTTFAPLVIFGRLLTLPRATWEEHTKRKKKKKVIEL